MAPHTTSRSGQQLKPQLKTIEKKAPDSQATNKADSKPEINKPLIRVGTKIPVDKGIYMDVLKRLGNGTFGEVFKVRRENCTWNYAMKIVAVNTAQEIAEAAEETDLLQYLSKQKLGEFILDTVFSFPGSKNGQKFMCHVFELLDRPLFDILDQGNAKPLHPVVVKAVGYQILSALECLHNIGVTHCDIKHDNVMFVNMKNNHLRVKLIDFGLSYYTKKLPQGHEMQNIKYRAPEVLFGLPLTEKVDIWSAAVLLVEMYTGFYLFPAKEEPELARYIEDYVGLPGEVENGTVHKSFLVYDEEKLRQTVMTQIEDQREILCLNRIPKLGYNSIVHHLPIREDWQFFNLLEKMLNPNAAKRIGAKVILQLPYFKSFNGDYNPEVLYTEPAFAGKDDTFAELFFR